MNTIAILIPTYGRSLRLESVARNIHQTTTVPHTIYFVCESSDSDSIREVHNIKEECIVVSGGTYVSAVNSGYRATAEPFVFCGSDDITFSPDWDKVMLREMENLKIGIVGATDEWVITKTGLHGSHFLVRRSYIQERSGVFDEKNVIYSSKYIHVMCDIETEQTAMGRGAFAMSKAFISHKHWYMKTAEMDTTYQRPIDGQKRDEDTYNKRREQFEIYKFEDLFRGIVTPVRKGEITVVIPSYNQTSYLKETIQSLRENTYHPYELIIIDDASAKDTVDYIKQQECIKVFNKEQLYVNANWNKGIQMASNRFVCIANNDITFSKDWDKYLVQELEKEEVWIASPFQTDPEYSVPYGKHERSGNIDLRGSCFMIDKNMIATTGYIPIDMLIWFGDWWFTHEVGRNHHRCVFTDKSCIHHYGSKSSLDMMKERKKLFFQILRGDAYAFNIYTGININHWLKVIYDNLELPSPV
jgi:GT2 family glycosyltransferase